MRGKARGFLCGILILLSGLMTCQFQEIMLSPEKHSIIVGEPLKINFPAPFGKNIKAQIYSNEAGHLKLKEKFALDKNYQCPVVHEPGQVMVRFSLFGVIPVRNMLVNVVPEMKVIPGGQSIGVLLHSQGVIVAGMADLTDRSGHKVNPAIDAGLTCGDIILKIDGEDVKSDEQVREMVNRAGDAGKTLTLEVKRGEEIFVTRVNPVFCKDTSRYRVGLMIRDSAAGIGTLTFYEPKSMIYGALGHVITDIGTSYPVNFLDGRIVGARVQDIRKGKRGQPGEKIGIFKIDKDISGSITKNTKMGIFGSLNKPLENQIIREPIPVAMADQIREGTAEILTVLQEEKVERFSIEIIKVNLRARQDGKGLVLKITDQRLLEHTGGIVQGMSGSPIIQNDKLIGAVTHVFVNDPTKGFGVPAEWMLRESEILQEIGTFENALKIAC